MLRGWKLKPFNKPIPQEKLNIVNKTRSNLFSWRGQFSPQLIEIILTQYCPPDAVILDPFAGSGTVLLEAGNLQLPAYGFDINPAAYILSQTYQLINKPRKQELIKILRELVDREFPYRIFQNEPVENLAEKLTLIRNQLDPEASQIFEALVILLDVANNAVTNELIQSKLADLVNLIKNLPYSEHPINIGLSDARCLPLPNNSIDFIITSPPYINVFNYHQNYRKSAELLGWDLLTIARSEIGSNRANRSNRFYTVVQYCLDMAETLRELSRVSKKNARIILVIGHQSNVLGVPFYNADIIEKMGIQANLFHKQLRQKREFKNKFGQVIREDIINFSNLKNPISQANLNQIARQVALDILKSGLSWVSPENINHLKKAIDRVPDIDNTPILDKRLYI
ncbi:DNA adenine methylase [Arthrospira platensis FACHB-971]|nr:DNA adenine methylase [Arthrospira platensis FACHB-971]MBD2670063.1 DNA adenine methylase [Arthrospira platensis FACHB-439]MBD2710584.1 DNA adenine methylase [Arthrospira platensis FACHB-835]